MFQPWLLYVKSLPEDMTAHIADTYMCYVLQDSNSWHFYFYHLPMGYLVIVCEQLMILKIIFDAIWFKDPIMSQINTCHPPWLYKGKLGYIVIIIVISTIIIIIIMLDLLQ